MKRSPLTLQNSCEDPGVCVKHGRCDCGTSIWRGNDQMQTTWRETSQNRFETIPAVEKKLFSDNGTLTTSPIEAWICIWRLDMLICLCMLILKWKFFNLIPLQLTFARRKFIKIAHKVHSDFQKGACGQSPLSAWQAFHPPRPTMRRNVNKIFYQCIL